MTIQLPDDLAVEIAARAAADGTDASSYTVQAIRKSLAQDARFEQLVAPVAEAFRDSGMNEDEAVDLFESEKHAIRAERRAAAS